MRKGWLIILGLVCLILLILQIRPNRPITQKPQTPTLQSPPQPPLPGEDILSGYAEATTRPQEDLSKVSHALGNLILLIKGTDPFPMGANEEFAAALRGKNRIKLRFLPDSHRCFNSQGQIVDRWQTPLFFHVKSLSRIDIRSAGPDRQLWTDDDLHRRYDGQYLKGKSLNPLSLDEN